MVDENGCDNRLERKQRRIKEKGTDGEQTRKMTTERKMRENFKKRKMEDKQRGS